MALTFARAVAPAVIRPQAPAGPGPGGGIPNGARTREGGCGGAPAMMKIAGLKRLGEWPPAPLGAAARFPSGHEMRPPSRRPSRHYARPIPKGRITLIECASAVCTDLGAPLYAQVAGKGTYRPEPPREKLYA